MKNSMEVGPTDRERWVIAQMVKAAALVADTMRSANDDEREFGRGELVMTAKMLVEGENKLSKNQLENLRDFVELAIEMAE